MTVTGLITPMAKECWLTDRRSLSEDTPIKPYRLKRPDAVPSPSRQQTTSAN